MLITLVENLATGMGVIFSLHQSGINMTRPSGFIPYFDAVKTLRKNT